jgi:hypothetical protein
VLPDLAADLSRLPSGRLVDLLVEIAASDPAVERRLRLTLQGDAGSTRELARAVDATLRTRRFLDYRESIAYAREAAPVVEALERAAEGPSARDVVPVVERALRHVLRVLHHGDDSAGTCGDVARSLLRIHVTAARNGRPDAQKLLRWLVQFTFDDQDFFNPDVRDYADALGDGGVAEYRAEVQRRAQSSPETFAPRFALQQLALLDRDAEAIVREFGGQLDGVYRFIAVATAFREIGEDDEALIWARRGMDLPATWQSRQLYDLVAQVLTERGAVSEAVAERVAGLRALPDPTSYAALRAAAEPVGSWPQLRPDALETLRKRALDHYLQALLQDGDVDRAWQALQETPGGAPQLTELQVASARAETHPGDAVPYVRRAVAETLQQADRRAYRSAVKQLLQLRSLHQRAGTPTEFDAYLAEVTQVNRRRPSFLDELRKAGLS